jgi:hypothetical protein
LNKMNTLINLYSIELSKNGTIHLEVTL